MTDQPATCPDCGHTHHGSGLECDHAITHGPTRFHRCLCLAWPTANRSCPPLMSCQGGPLGYADVWYLQRGHSVRGPADALITPDVLLDQSTGSQS
ncbi:hypothetical protein ACFWNR_06265 [Streptomyces virginiae]|uniref:hypothetical protein n=1 Tax=Streptomyces virginiae TaxID=1961 RepID=UPI0036697A50